MRKKDKEFEAEFECVKANAALIMQYIFQIYKSLPRINAAMIVGIHAIITFQTLLLIKKVWNYDAYKVLIEDINKKWERVRKGEDDD